MSSGIYVRQQRPIDRPSYVYLDAMHALISTVRNATITLQKIEINKNIRFMEIGRDGIRKRCDKTGDWRHAPDQIDDGLERELRERARASRFQ